MNRRAFFGAAAGAVAAGGVASASVPKAEVIRRGRGLWRLEGWRWVPVRLRDIKADDMILAKESRPDGVCGPSLERALRDSRQDENGWWQAFLLPWIIRLGDTDEEMMSEDIVEAASLAPIPLDFWAA